MWKFINDVFAYLRKDAVIVKNQEIIMAKQDEILADLATTKTNLIEVQGDLDELVALNKTQADNIATLDQAIADLKTQLGDAVNLDAIAAAVADIKDVSRKAADVVPEPVVEPPAA